MKTDSKQEFLVDNTASEYSTAENSSVVATIELDSSDCEQFSPPRKMESEGSRPSGKGHRKSGTGGSSVSDWGNDHGHAASPHSAWHSGEQRVAAYQEEKILTWTTRHLIYESAKKLGVWEESMEPGPCPDLNAEYDPLESLTEVQQQEVKSRLRSLQQKAEIDLIRLNNRTEQIEIQMNHWRGGAREEEMREVLENAKLVESNASKYEMAVRRALCVYAQEVAEEAKREAKKQQEAQAATRTKSSKCANRGGSSSFNSDKKVSKVRYHASDSEDTSHSEGGGAKGGKSFKGKGGQPPKPAPESPSSQPVAAAVSRFSGRPDVNLGATDASSTNSDTEDATSSSKMSYYGGARRKNRNMKMWEFRGEDGNETP